MSDDLSLERINPMAQPARSFSGDAVGEPTLFAALAELRNQQWQQARRINGRDRSDDRPIETAVWGKAGVPNVGESPQHKVRVGGLLYEFHYELKAAADSGDTEVSLYLNGVLIRTLTIAAGSLVAPQAERTINGVVTKPGDLLMVDTTQVGVWTAGVDPGPSAFAYIG